MIDCRLYKEYFPIKTEEQKDKFLEEHRADAYIFLAEEPQDMKNAYIKLESYYISRFKKAYSLFGKMKHKNVIHNQHVAHQMQRDERLVYLRQKISHRENLLYALCMCEDVTIEEINTILQRMNNKFHVDVFMAALGIIAVIAWLLIGCTIG